MTRTVQSTAIAAALSAALATGLMGGAALAQQPAPAAAAAAAPAKSVDPATLLATVNGTPIREADIILAEEDLGSGLAQIPAEQRHDYVLSFLIDTTLLAQAAQAEKLDQTPQVQQRLAYARTKALMEAMMLREAKQAVTEDAKRKTYDEFVKSAPPEEEVHARHILVDDEAKAKEIAAKAKAGADFAKLAEENSKDNTDGGDLGYFSKEQMVPEFAEAAFKLDKGQISDPVKTQFGWHIIKIEDKRTKPVPSFDQVEAQVDQYLQRKAQADLVTKLRADAKIVKPEGATPAAAPADAKPADAKPADGKPAAPAKP